MTDVLEAVATDERVTPQPLFDELHAIFHFGWDFAALAANSKCGRCYFGPDHPIPVFRDALTISWVETLDVIGAPKVGWCNPPYSRGQIPRWCQKAIEEAALGVTTVMLLPADTSTVYYHDLIAPHEHYFQRGRNRFAGAPLDQGGKLNSAKFGSVLAVYRPPLPARWRKV